MTYHEMREMTEVRFEELDKAIVHNTHLFETTNESRFKHNANALLKTLALNYALNKLACYKTLRKTKLKVSPMTKGAIDEIFYKISISHSLPTNIGHIFH